MTPSFNIQLNNTTNSAQEVAVMDYQGYYNSQNAIVPTTNRYTFDLTQELAVSFAENFDQVFVCFYSTIGNIWSVYGATNVYGGYFQNVSQIIDTLNAASIWIFLIDTGNVFYTDTLQNKITSISTGKFVSGQIIANQSVEYGSLIYSSADLANSSINRISLSNPFWNNPSVNSIDGPGNRNGISCIAPFNPVLYQQGFLNVFVSTSKTVYLGFTNKDCAANIYVNNELIFSIPATFNPVDDSGILTNINNQLGTSYPTSTPIQSFWYIVPIYLPFGTNVVQVLFGDGLSSKNIALEVYDNTQEEIASATNASQLNIIATSLLYNSAGTGSRFF
jgi:hypothetical protein